MNYLAHLFLSGKKSDLMAGNFLGDFLRMKEVVKLPLPMQAGIKLHHLIDSYTDSHPKNIEAIELLRRTQGKYAPVAHDIIMDYLLFYNWKRYSNMEYDQFCQYVYIVLGRYLKYIPESQKERVSNMIDARWLHVYTTLEGLENTMKRMDFRTRFPSKFFLAVEQLREDFTIFNTLFNEFFPDMIAQVHNFILQNEELE